MASGRKPTSAGAAGAEVRARKGRGAVSNFPHRFEAVEREADGDALDAALFDDEPLPPLATTVTVETARSLITYNDSPDIPFDRSINPFRGCEHGCTYCYARPTHSYLNLSPGLDFETKLVAKRNAAEVLRRELAAPWLPRRSRGNRHGDRRLSADRTRVEDHAWRPRGAQRGAPPARDRHEVRADRARHRPARADGVRSPCGSFHQRHDARCAAVA